MARKPHNRELNDKERTYCMARSIGKTRTEAAIEAGYSARAPKVQAAKLESRQRVQDEISRLRGLNSLETGDKAGLDEVKVFLTREMRSGNRTSKAAADSLKDLLLKDKDANRGDPKPLFMASLLAVDAIEAIVENRPEGICVLMGKYESKVQDVAGQGDVA